MKAIKFIPCLGAWLLLLCSCSREDNTPAPGSGEPNQAKVTISLQVNDDPDTRTEAMPGIAATDTIHGIAVTCTASEQWKGDDKVPEDSLPTRAVDGATIRESVINDLWGIQFNEKGELVGRPVYKDGLAGQSSATLMLTQTPTGIQHTVYFVTNSGNNALFTENNVPTIEQFRALMHRYPNEAGVTANNVLLMTGSYTGELKDKAILSQSIVMTRAAAKVNFDYETGNFSGGSLRVLSVQLRNVPLAFAYLLPTAATYPLPGSHADYLPEASPDEAAGSYTWYLPENVRGTNPAITWEGNKSRANAPAGQADYATFAEVRGEVSATDGTKKNITYLFYIGKDITDYSVRRNTVYTLSVDFRGIDENDQRVVIGVSTPWLATNTAVTDVTGVGATVRATITADGGSPILAKGFYLSEDKNETGTESPVTRLFDLPEMPSAFTRAAFEPVELTKTFTGLRNGKTYYVRPYATNQYGTTVGEQVTFTTTSNPTVVGEVLEVGTTTAKVKLTITDNGASGITDRGVVYSTQKDFKPDATSGVIRISSGVLNELTLGTGTASNPYLVVNTVYYLRAYAANATGTGYGKQLMLATYTAPTFAAATLTEVKDLYVQVNINTQSVIPTGAEMGVSWSASVFTDPKRGMHTAGTKSTNGFAAKFNPYPGDSWYFYPYARLYTDGAPFYDTTRYDASLMPSSPKPTYVVEEDYGWYSITLFAGAQTLPAGTTMTSRGIVFYSNQANFDPTASDVVTFSPRSLEKVDAYNYYMNEDFAPGKYLIRSFATNSQKHTYYSQAEELIMKPWFAMTYVDTNFYYVVSKEGIPSGYNESIAGIFSNTSWEAHTKEGVTITPNKGIGLNDPNITYGMGVLTKIIFPVNTGPERDVSITFVTTKNGELPPATYVLKFKQESGL